MSFTIYPLQYFPWEIDPEKLKHHYYVQLTPDRRHLVPGMLKQDGKPADKNWLDVTAIDRDFTERYFVQYTDFNTLVPGSLVQENKLPAGRWKEIKRPRTKFHKVVFSDPYNLAFYTGNPPGTLVNFSSQNNFIGNRVNPILNLLYPDAPRDPINDMPLPGGKLILFILYYFKGNFAELGNDATKLIPFGIPNFFGARVESSVPNLTAPFAMSAMYQSTYSLYGRPDAPDGTYSFVVGILTNNVVTEYIVLENILVKSTSNVPVLIGL